MPRENTQIIAIGDPQLLSQRAQLLGLPLRVTLFDRAQSPRQNHPGEIFVQPVSLACGVTPGQLEVGNAKYVLETLDAAIDGCLERSFDAMVTAPVHKGVINDAGVHFSGHTEYLADRTHTQKVVMMLATQGLRVALATTHIPLKDVSGALNRNELEEVLRITHDQMQRDFAIKQPRILVCGLNPHAGEGGHMGREEIDIIIPVLEKLQAEGLRVSGPYPADTVFTPKYMAQADVIMAMFHDQGLPVLKYIGFGAAVNITLGLPIIRTSVDHGTALNLAGTDAVDSGSINVALDVAFEMAMGQRGEIFHEF
jgi:4-hydroxythreonine-4-phosphate dehydrogenase